MCHTVTGPCPCQANYFPITGPDALSPHCHHPHHHHQHLPSVATALTSHPVPLPTPRASGEKDNLWDVVTRAEPSLSSPTKIFTISPRAHPRKGLSVVNRISCFPAFFLFCISSAKNNTNETTSQNLLSIYHIFQVDSSSFSKAVFRQSWVL